MEKYKVRKVRYGKNWAVDRITEIGTRFYTKDYTRYFDSREKAEAYKERKEVGVQ